MAHLKLMLDTNVVLDYLLKRPPFYESARLLMIVGRLGDFDLCITSSQFTDLIYVLTDGGKKRLLPGALQVLQGLRTFVSIHEVTSSAIDVVLHTSWNDAEDALLYKCALDAKADCLVTRNTEDFESDLIPVMNCDQLFEWVRDIFNVNYEEIEFYE